MNYRKLRHAAQQGAIVAMEASCFAALVYLFGAGEGQVPIIAFIFVGWLMLAFNRWLFGLAVWDTPQGKLYSILSGIVGISLLIGLTSDEVGLLAGPLTFFRALSEIPRFFSGNAPLTAGLLGGLVLYYRVLVTVREPIGVMGIARRVISALAVFIWVVFLMEVQRGSVSWDVVIVFGAFALLAFVLSRTHELDMIPGVAPLPVTPAWTGNIAGIIGVTLAGGFLIQAFSVEPLTHIGALLQPIWSFLVILLAFPIRLILILLDPLIQLLDQQVDLEMPTPTPAEGVEGQADPITVNPEVWVEEWLLILAGIGGLIVAYVIFRQAYRRFRERSLTTFAPKTSNEQSERGNWFPFQFRNPFARRGEYGVETVRDLYKNVLVFGENQGVVRAEDDTPYEYLAPLTTKYPTAQAEFQALTEAYVASHYGEVEFTREEIYRLKAAWEKIKALPTV
jgi:hypothetical protein